MKKLKILTVVVAIIIINISYAQQHTNAHEKLNSKVTSIAGASLLCVKPHYSQYLLSEINPWMFIVGAGLGLMYYKKKLECKKAQQDIKSRDTEIRKLSCFTHNLAHFMAFQESFAIQHSTLEALVPMITKGFALSKLTEMQQKCKQCSN